MNYRSKEQAAYAKLIAGAIKPGAPLLAGAAAGLGKTHGYSIPLIKSGRRIAIAMSTRQLIEQYLDSDALRSAVEGAPATVCELKSRRQFDSDKAYREQRSEALAAQVLLVTHAAAFIDSLAPGYAELRSRDVILFDEADLLADAADLRSTFAIAPDILKACRADGQAPHTAALLVKQAATEAEDRAAASAILYALEHPAWYRVVGFDEDGALVLRHRMPGRMLKRLVADAPRCIFTSGTLQVSARFDYFVRTMGLDQIDPASRHIDPVHHGKLEIDVATDDLDDAAKAQKILASERPTLVLTTSHADAEAIGRLVPEATVRAAGEALSDAVARCLDDGILVCAGAWSGLDAPRLRWKTVVLPKAPYGAPVEIDGQQLTHYLDSKVVAIRRTSQGLHRGLRTPDAACRLILLDRRSNRPELLEAIPARFRAGLWSVSEGARREVVMSEVERRCRVQALRHYGSRCMWEGCAITADHLLDVHHLNPVAEGVRQTKLDDLQVLCKNHHAEAHFRMKEA